MSMLCNAVEVVATHAREIVEGWSSDSGQYQKHLASKAWELLATLDDAVGDVGNFGGCRDAVLIEARFRVREEMFFGGAPQSILPYLAIQAAAELHLLRGVVQEELRINGQLEMRDELEEEVRRELRDELEDEVREELREELEEEVRSRFEASI